MSMLTFMASMAIVCWVPMSVLSGERIPGGMLIPVGMGTLGILGLVLSIHLALEAARLSRLGYREPRWEWERSIRPRF